MPSPSELSIINILNIRVRANFDNFAIIWAIYITAKQHTYYGKSNTDLSQKA